MSKSDDELRQDLPEVADGYVECAVACGDEYETLLVACECCSSLHPYFLF